MKQTHNMMLYGFFIALMIVPGALSAHPAHDGHHKVEAHSNANMWAFASTAGQALGVVLAANERMADSPVSGQGEFVFRVLYTKAHLPAEAVEALGRAHGGFGVDRREGHGETYFALPGAGILQISGDLKTTRLIETPPEMKDLNLHNATVWYHTDGTPLLSFPANDAGKVFTTTLDGKLVHTLPAPDADTDFDHPKVNDYFRGGGKFAPTDVEQLDGLFFVTTGYSDLDYVLTARIFSTTPFDVKWHDLAFGGKGDGPGQFGTGHGITTLPKAKHLDVSDRANAKIERFTNDGQHLGTVRLPSGSFPCDIDYAEEYGVIGCLHGPDRTKGAPIYILKGDSVVSTILPKEELGLEGFQHVHDAVFRVINGVFYIIAQSWNPGDFVILQQVTE